MKGTMVQRLCRKLLERIEEYEVKASAETDSLSDRAAISMLTHMEKDGIEWRETIESFSYLCDRFGVKEVEE